MSWIIPALAFSAITPWPDEVIVGIAVGLYLGAQFIQSQNSPSMVSTYSDGGSVAVQVNSVASVFGTRIEPDIVYGFDSLWDLSTGRSFVRPPADLILDMPIVLVTSSVPDMTVIYPMVQPGERSFVRSTVEIASMSYRSSPLCFDPCQFQVPAEKPIRQDIVDKFFATLIIANAIDWLCEVSSLTLLKEGEG